MLLKPERAFPSAHQELHSTTLGWRMVNPQMPDRWTYLAGAPVRRSWPDLYGITREAQDEFALTAIAGPPRPGTGGFYGELGGAGARAELARDEGIRADTSLEKLAG